MYAYSYAHLGMIGGIVLVAAGLQDVIGGILHPTPRATFWLLGCGIAVYLGSEVLFRRLLGIGTVRVRLIAGGLALGTVPIGLAVGALPQLALLVALMVSMLAVETGGTRTG
jgi:low temperature requirement protein LtrA